MTLDTKVHRNLTELYIKQRPVSIIVKRTTKVQGADGGWTKSAPVALAAQHGRIVELLRAQATERRTTDEGDIVIPTHILVTMPDADFQRKDTFIAYGELWEVIHVSRLPEWRLSLELVSRGRI